MGGPLQSGARRSDLSKTDGFVLQIGDSITYSMAYGIWMRGGASRTGEDLAITGWFRVGDFPAGINVTSKGGLYLAARDVDVSRGMTAAEASRPTNTSRARATEPPRCRRRPPPRRPKAT
jgi:hypothetical protein